MTQIARINDFPSYLISDEGNVFSADYNHTGEMKMLALKTGSKPNDYYRVGLFKNRVRHYLLVHRLVAEAFCERPAGKNVVDHIDGCKENNRADNLRWLTQRENVHCGRMVIKPVIRSDGKVYKSICATQADGFSKGSVCECCKGSRKTTGGYGWRYADEIVQATSA